MNSRKTRPPNGCGPIGDHGPALPETLEAFVPEQLLSIPPDPLTGASLLYRAEPYAYVVCSVGANLADDGSRSVLDPTWAFAS